MPPMATTSCHFAPAMRSRSLRSIVSSTALHDCQFATVLYGDEDEINSRGRRARPYFKPEWNEELFLAQDYISASCLIRTDAARAALPIAA